jgi:hypothetical protein
MKKLAGVIFLFGLGFFLNGCYTVVQGDYHYTDNSQTTTIIINNPIPPPPPPVIEPYIPPNKPILITRPNIIPKEKTRSSDNNNPRETGGRDSGGRNGNSRR